jgi:peptidoglycan hydrolase-like protein with peptidoglycan-binding domain
MKFIACIFVALGLLLGAASAHAEAGKRVALVLGNGAYSHAPGLPNPPRDAEAMAAALDRLGFDVELGVDLDLAGMRRAVLSYARKLDGAEVALFYYAGHGMQVAGQNYLLPVEAEISSEVDLDFAAIPARLILAQMERWPATKIVILDACRDNPFATALSRSMGPVRASTALSRGLAQIEASGGTLLAYATDPGDVAADGEGDNSPFTEALLKHVETPGVEIHTMLARVRADVFKATRQRQRPWTESSLIGEFFLASPTSETLPVTSAMLGPPTPAPPAPPSAGLDPRQIELAVWDAAQTGGTAEDYREYLRQYPDGIFATLARNRLAALTRQETPKEEGTPGSAESVPGAQATVPPDSPAAAGRERLSTATQASPGQAVNGSDEAGAAAGGTIGGSPSRAQDATGTGTPEAPKLAFAPGASGTPEGAEEQLGLDGAKRREVQARLLAAGHDPRGVDGVFGPGTRMALSAWQRAEGLAATGYLDAAGLALLERRTETAYAAWVERQRAEEARRAAAARARSERQAARASARTEPAAVEPEAQRAVEFQVPPPSEMPVVAAPSPSPAPTASDNPLATPARSQSGSARERYERNCYFVTEGKPDLRRVCE